MHENGGDSKPAYQRERHSSVSDGKRLLLPSELKKRKAANKKDWGECMLTFDKIQEPVRAGDGHVYERWAIAKWLAENNNRSPLTNVTISPELVTLTDSDEGRGARHVLETPKNPSRQTPETEDVVTAEQSSKTLAQDGSGGEGGSGQAESSDPLDLKVEGLQVQDEEEDADAEGEFSSSAQGESGLLFARYFSDPASPACTRLGAVTEDPGEASVRRGSAEVPQGLLGMALAAGELSSDAEEKEGEGPQGARSPEASPEPQGRSGGGESELAAYERLTQSPGFGVYASPAAREKVRLRRAMAFRRR